MVPKKPTVVKRWFIFCEPCSFKKIVTGDKPGEGLVEIKTASVPGGAPVLDPTTKKTKTKPDLKRPKKFKCPQCGRGVTAKKLPDVYEKAYKAIDEERIKREQEEEKRKRLEDGQPPKRKPDEDFMG
jgi:hypothetical protein